jgi:alpha-L-fucosidase
MKTNILLSYLVSSALMAGTHLSAAPANGGETIKPAVESPAQRDAPKPAAADPVPAPPIAVIPPGDPESPAAKEARKMERTRWFRDAKFGMFICWGLYSVPGGSWKGKVLKHRYAEWIEWALPIPHAEYAAIADTWMPDRFDADAWVKTAKDAGMKYLLITAKFHDGFLMYPSKVTGYNIYDRTPWKRDPVKEVAEACARQGLTFGVYWNHAYDWQHPDALTPDAVASKGRNFDRYLDDVCLPQLKEMLTYYPQISFMWFDHARRTPEMTPERSKRIADLIHALRPNLIFNSRLGGGEFHDYKSMGDNAIPPTGFPGVWETAATINDTWGYKATDENWKSSGQIIFNLVDIVSKGGNYILNVGPMGDGRIPQPSLDVLAGVGAWMQVNGEAIYGAGRTPFGSELGALDAEKKDPSGKPVFNQSNDWRCTVKPADWSWGKPGKLYFHLFTWPAGGFELPAMNGRVVKAYLLSDPSHTALAVTTREARTSIALPGKPAGAGAPVLCVEVE